MIEADVFEFKVSSEEIDWQFFLLNATYEFTEGGHYDLLDDVFDHRSH